MSGTLTLRWRLLTFLAGLSTRPIEKIGPELTRAGMRKKFNRPGIITGVPAPLERVTDESIAGVRVRRYQPAQPSPGTVVFFHGGGWVVGDVVTHDIPCRAIAAASKRTVVSVDYRLAPEHPFPAAIEDCLAVTRELVRSGPVLVAGDSAGGHLAAVIARRFQAEGLALAGQLLLYPVTDCAAESDSYKRYGTGFFLTAATARYFVRSFLPDPATRSSPDASPVRAEPAKLPAAYVLLAECDVLHDEGVAYAELLRRGGTAVTVDEVPGVIHGFFSLQGMSESQAAVGRVAQFIDHALSPGA